MARPRSGERLVLADALAEGVMRSAKVADFQRLADVTVGRSVTGWLLAHPLRGVEGGDGRVGL